MNKKELAAVVVLILLIPAWLTIDRVFIKPLFPDPPPTPTPAPAAPQGPDGAPAAAPTADPLPEVTVPEATPVPGPAEPRPIPRRTEEERTVTLTNQVLHATFSNLGAGLTEARLLRYPETLEDRAEEGGSIPLDRVVTLEFGMDVRSPALVYDDPGLNAGTDFAVEAADDRRGVVFVREVMPGLFFERTVTLADGYEFEVTDRWENRTDKPIRVPEMSLHLGPMYPRPEASQKFGPYVGVDARHLSSGVKHYAKEAGKIQGVYTETVEEGFHWFSVKNKFFTQVLTPEPGDWLETNALLMRARQGGEARVGMAQAAARITGVELRPGTDMIRRYGLYVGPIDMERLEALGDNQDELINFRLFRVFVPICRLMMNGLNLFHDLTGNWGVAIILLTFVVRMLFWPLTQKGAENMKRMSELSPQMKEIREKHKSNPQKLNQEMSKFYKEHKVNPMAGCLPMVVQIPVFISLYGVLRVAVDLRFADFLWINDLSEQEALFSVAGFPVNILPLTMGATMILQQRLTPSNMDEQQRKIMMMMPIVFLFITYTMPSGLLLYWTTSNLISIYQTTHTRRRDAKKAAAKGAGDAKSAPGKLKSVDNPKASKPGSSRKKGGK